ncbi:MAG: hypothetical protein J5832_02420 [Clostridia bacterium]|nr:hypothetical protein [Clostridia bacterium]
MRKNSIISFVIVLAMIVSLVLTSCASGENDTTAATTAATAAATTEATTEATTAEPIDEPVVEIPYIFTLDEDGWREYGIPSSFDLRSVDTDGDGVGDRCFVTKVKFQNPYGTCWGFAALASAEITLLGSLYLDDPDAYKTLDLSEKQFTYFMNVPLDDETNPQNGEGLNWAGALNVSTYDSGGNSYLSMSLFAQGIGLSEEYKEGNEVFIYRGANGYTEQHLIDGEYRNFCYSYDDDWSIPEEYRFKFDYLMKDAIVLPNPAKYNDDGEYEYNAEATEAIKLQLLLRRGVTIGFYADSASPNEEDERPGVYIDPYTWSHYTWEQKDTDHLVTIVGWDDNYPKENFLEGHQPPENGAWLVKNSWGSGEEEFPNKGDGSWGIRVPLKDSEGNVMTDENGEPIMTGSGYFWMSYYDMSIHAPTVFIFEKKTEENDYIIDQHNYLPLSTFDYRKSDKEVKIANVFKAEGTQLLDAFSVVVPEEKLSVHYEAYLLCKRFNDPEDGLLVAEGDEYFDHAGLYRIKFDDQTLVQYAQYYSIVVTMTDEDGNYYIHNFEIDVLKDNPECYTVVNAKESYGFMDGEWADLKEYSNMLAERAALSEDDYMGVVDNFPIKAFSYGVEGRMNLILASSLSDGNLYLTEGKDKTVLKVRFAGDADREIGVPVIKWGFAEEDQDVIAIEEMKNLGQVKVTALKPGTVHLTVTVDGIGTTVARFDVRPYEMDHVDIYNIAYEHDNMETYISVTANDGTVLKEGEDYNLVYTNNEKCGVAKVEIVPVEGGMELAEGLSSVYYFIIVPKAPEIVSTSLVDGKLSCSISDQSGTGVVGYQLDYRIVGTEEWSYGMFDSPNIEIDVEEGCDYEIAACSFVIVDGVEMSEELAEQLYDEAEGGCYVYGYWSEIVTVENS